MLNNQNEQPGSEYNMQEVEIEAPNLKTTFELNGTILRSRKDEEISSQGLRTYYEKLVKDYKKIQKKLKPYFDAGLNSDASNINQSDVVLNDMVNEYNKLKMNLNGFLKTYGMFVKKRKNSFGRFSEELFNEILLMNSETPISGNLLNIDNDSSLNLNKKNPESGNFSGMTKEKNRKKQNDENRENMNTGSNFNENIGEMYQKTYKNSGLIRDGVEEAFGEADKDNQYFFMEEPIPKPAKKENARNSNLKPPKNVNYKGYNANSGYNKNQASRNLRSKDDLRNFNHAEMKFQNNSNMHSNKSNLYPSYPIKEMNQKNSPGNKNQRGISPSDNRQRGNDDYFNSKDTPKNMHMINNDIYNNQIPYEIKNQYNEGKMYQNKPNYNHPGMIKNQEDHSPYFYNSIEHNPNKSKHDFYQVNKEPNIYQGGIYEQTFFDNNTLSSVFQEQTVNPNVFFNETAPPTYNQHQKHPVKQQSIKRQNNITQPLEKRRENDRQYASLETNQENIDIFVNHHTSYNKNIQMETQEMQKNNMLPKMRVIDVKRIEECLGDIKLSEEGKAYLLEMCDLFIESVCYTSCCISKNRNSKYLDIEDVKLAVKTDNGIEIPDDNFYQKNTQIDAEHEKKVGLISKENSKRNKM